MTVRQEFMLQHSLSLSNLLTPTSLTVCDPANSLSYVSLLMPACYWLASTWLVNSAGTVQRARESDGGTSYANLFLLTCQVAIWLLAD